MSVPGVGEPPRACWSFSAAEAPHAMSHLQGCGLLGAASRETRFLPRGTQLSGLGKEQQPLQQESPRQHAVFSAAMYRCCWLMYSFVPSSLDDRLFLTHLNAPRTLRLLGSFLGFSSLSLPTR